jgi:hypothetical protein
MMRATPAGKACVNSSGVMDMASMGRRVSHPSMAPSGSRRGCRMWRRASLCEVAVCASGSMSTHVYAATTWPALRIDSSPVAMPPHNSRLRGRMYLGVSARASVGGGLEVRGGTMGGVRGDMAAGQAGRASCGVPLVGCRDVPSFPVCSGKILAELSLVDRYCGGQGQGFDGCVPC